MELIIASNNKHKIEEINALFNDEIINVELKSLSEAGIYDDIAETAVSIEGNAALKSSYIYQKYSFNCFADDSGLEVFALGGEPGVKSARYAGEQKNDLENCKLLLKNLSEKTNRKAQFKTVISLQIEGKEYQFEGIIKGTIGFEFKGKNGFGYDPLFIPEGFDITFAEMSNTEKNRISHRAVAIEKLIQFLKQLK